jgi:hypothetical protein
MKDAKMNIHIQTSFSSMFAAALALLLQSAVVSAVYVLRGA